MASSDPARLRNGQSPDALVAAADGTIGSNQIFTNVPHRAWRWIFAVQGPSGRSPGALVARPAGHGVNVPLVEAMFPAGLRSRRAWLGHLRQEQPRNRTELMGGLGWILVIIVLVVILGGGLFEHRRRRRGLPIR